MAKKKHAEAHGGAWKVAYADFVTAMMALFMVLWISAQKDEILLATSKYFQNPFTSPMEASSGVMDGKKDYMPPTAGAPSRTFTPEMYEAIAEEFLKLLDVSKNIREKLIDIKATSEGIIITIFNRKHQPVFEENSTTLTKWGEYVAENLAWIIDRFHMRVRIDSHTPKGAVPVTAATDAWSLTSDQSNVMRRRLVHFGLESTKIDRVTGFGDTHPVKDLAPNDPSNYRVELTLTATDATPRLKKTK